MGKEVVNCAFCGEEFEAAAMVHCGFSRGSFEMLAVDPPPGAPSILPICDDCVDCLLFEMAERVKERGRKNVGR